jgi:chemotaxis response regulator CheB
MPDKGSFYVVAIGGSAGGQQPIWDFFSQLPPDSGAAFIVIQHLGRDYISIADRLLAKHTTMPVCWATNHQQVRPNTIYLLPVNKLMTIEAGYLQVANRLVEDHSNWAVDIFFHSLAKAEKTQAIGIVLSGAGSDGTLGAIAIHQERGLVMAQDPQTAEFRGMPQSAILKAHPTQILSPKRLAHAVLSFIQ